MEEVVKERQSIFKERKHITLGMKLVCAFAITYYILFFSFMTYILIKYNTVFDEAYIDENLHEIVASHHFTLFIIEWVLLAAIVTSLFMVFFKKRLGKFLFMIFTIFLVVCQFYTTFPPAYEVYILELLIVLIIAPLRVISKFTERIQIETQKINPFKDTKMNHITLSGELGSGKSTVANYLISKMPFRIVSAGLLFRQLAAKHGMSAKEFNEFIESDPKYDHYVDDTMAELGRTDEKIIFDSRMAWHFVPDSFKIYLYVDVDTATERIFNDKGRVSESYSDKETARQEIIDRRKSELLRYQNFYHCNLDDYSNYDLIVDTSHASRDEVNELVFNSFKAFEEGKEYTRIWLSPNSLILKGDEPDDSGEQLIINKQSGKFVVERGFSKVKKALQNRESLVAVDIVKC